MKNLIWIILVAVMLIGCKQEPTDIWPNGHIPFTLTGFTPQEASLIYACMIEWETVSQRRIKFIDIDVADDKDIKDGCRTLRIIRGNSTVLGGFKFYPIPGYQDSQHQMVMINKVEQNIILHELGHVIGLMDEQCRPDRDLYISMSADYAKHYPINIFIDQLGYDWKKYPYDSYSIMHTPSMAGEYIDYVNSSDEFNYEHGPTLTDEQYRDAVDKNWIDVTCTSKDGDPYKRCMVDRLSERQISPTDARKVFDIYSDSRDE